MCILSRYSELKGNIDITDVAMYKIISPGEMGSAALAEAFHSFTSHGIYPGISENVNFAEPSRVGYYRFSEGILSFCICKHRVGV